MDHIEIYLDERFPVKDVEAIGRRMTDAKAVVPGCIPPPSGTLDIAAIEYEKALGLSFVFFPDRNLVSRMARIAQGVEKYPLGRTAQLAADVMAFAQSLDILIDPSVSFHELAHLQGNDVANIELRYFRAADFGQASAWIDIAMGRADKLPVFEPGDVTELNLAAPLRRWRRNYLVGLTIAKLELSPSAPEERALALIEWMRNDFFVAGPALMYGLMFFGPRSRKADLFKQLRSPDRERALTGIRNAAWDMTYLSEFSRQIAESAELNEEPKRFLFATGDTRLADISRVLTTLANNPLELEADLNRVLLAWWGPSEAGKLAFATHKTLLKAGDRPPPTYRGSSQDPIGEWTIESELWIRNSWDLA